MSEHMFAWSIVLVVAVVGLVGLFHAGMNLGSGLASLVEGVERLFGTHL